MKSQSASHFEEGEGCAKRRVRSSVATNGETEVEVSRKGGGVGAREEEMQSDLTSFIMSQQLPESLIGIELI